jgi:hypothetical protein
LDPRVVVLVWVWSKFGNYWDLARHLRVFNTGLRRNLAWAQLLTNTLWGVPIRPLLALKSHKLMVDIPQITHNWPLVP